MNRDTIRQIAVAAVIVITIIINVLANALPLNNQNTGAISDSFMVYFTPAGYVFSIWGLIYTGLIAFAIFQALPAQRNNASLRRASWWLILANTANSAWIFLWHYNIFPATLVAMLVVLAGLIMTYLQLGIGKAKVSAGVRWALHVPISIYLGWITVATIANVTAILYILLAGGPGSGVPVDAVTLLGISPELWTALVLVVATAIVWANSLTRRDIAYALVPVWAFIGIGVKWPSVGLVALPAYVLAALILVGIVVGQLRPQRA
jgi:hypothetical protein